MSSTETEYVLITEYFYPDTASTGQLMTDLAVGLEERGLDMTVYTGQPNYHSGDLEKQPHESKHDNVLIKRIRAPQVRQSSLPRRLFNWTVFTTWMFATLLISRTKQNREVIFLSNPPFISVAMWLVCRVRGWNYTFIIYDLYPDYLAELNYIRKNGLIDQIWSTLQRRVLLSATRIVALGPQMKERISDNAGEEFDSDTIHIIHNWEDPEFIKPIDKSDNWFSQKHELDKQFSVLYSGNIGDFHDLETLVEAMAALDDKRAKALIIGEGDNKDNIVAHAESLGVRGNGISFLPYQPLDDLPYSLTAADVSVVTVREETRGICVSSKLYTAMAAGTPVLVIAHPNDDEARITSQFDAGIQASPGDVEGVQEAIETWIENPDLLTKQGHNARKAFEQNFTREQSVRAYYELLSGE
jgi:glycosyltransferase involved in cell wall biosynthesis